MLWRLKTLGLFLYLTLLLVAIGALISYLFAGTPVLGISVMLVISVLLSFVSYFNCKRVALRANKARIVTEYEEPRLYSIVKNLALKADLPMPEVGVVESPMPNAFATGRNPNNAAVVATRGLLTLMDDEELEGVLAHEMSHVKNRDILVMAVASAVASIITYAARIAMYAYLFSDRRDAKGLILVIVAEITMPIAAIMIQLGISRKREYLADESGARMINNPRALAKALDHIDRFSRGEYEEEIETRPVEQRRQDPFDKATRNPSDIYDCAHMWIANPFKGGMASLFSTHPPMEERIRRLNKLADEMGL